MEELQEGPSLGLLKETGLSATTLSSATKMTEAGCSWVAVEAMPVTMVDPRAEAASTYSVGGAGVKAAVTAFAFRLCLMSPRFGEMSPSVLFLVPFLLCSAPLAFVGGAGIFLDRDPGGTEPTGPSWSFFSAPISSLCAFLFCRIMLGCFLESI